VRELTLGSEVPSHLIILVHIQFVSLEIKGKKKGKQKGNKFDRAKKEYEK